MPDSDILLCRTCNQGYERRNYTPSGIKNRRCKSCVRVMHQIWQARNRGASIAYMKKYRDAMKVTALNAYGGCVCVCCGVTEIAFLSLDHINNDGNVHRKAIGKSSGTGFYTWLKVRGWPPGLQVLCMNCQFGKRICGTCPHKGPKETNDRY